MRLGFAGDCPCLVGVSIHASVKDATALLASTSHLLQMRGLKHCPQKEYNNPIMSHLLQMRGLKRNQPYKHYRPRQVASFTDAWIETYQSAGVFSQCQSHLLQMRGLKRPF